jgi:hypothetical protein
MRSQYKEGTLSEEKTNKLNDLGFTWKIREFPNSLDAVSVAARWDKHFNELREYKAAFGHSNVKYSDNEKLHTFIWRQRAKYNAGNLDRRRVAKLERLGFDFAACPYSSAKRGAVASWNTRYNELLEYKQEFGDCNVSINYTANKKLGEWVSCIQFVLKAAHQYLQTHSHILFLQVHTQRRSFKAGKMPTDRIEKLNAIGFMWVRNKVRAEDGSSEVIIDTV